MLNQIESHLDMLQRPRRILLRPDTERSLIEHFESVGREWKPVIRNVPVVVMEIEDEYEIECEAPDLTGEDE
jgi:HSP20 family molecular chaperone IbpA